MFKKRSHTNKIGDIVVIKFVQNFTFFKLSSLWYSERIPEM